MLSSSGLRSRAEVVFQRVSVALACGLLSPLVLGQVAPAVTPVAQVRAQPADVQSAPALPKLPGLGAEPSTPGVPGGEATMAAAPPRADPTDFERLATQANGGRAVWRLGRWQVLPEWMAKRPMPGRLPGDYRVQVHDEVVVTVWGSVEAEWRLRVDAAGRVTLPRAGPVTLAGLALDEVEPALRGRLDRVFRAYELAATLGELSPLRVRVAGFVERPGEYVLPPQATVMDALAMARGTAAGGSLRRARLLRPGQASRDIDLYMLLDGTGAPDVQLRSGDVIQVDAALPQVAVVGAVNRAAVFEFEAGATLRDAMRLAGGLSPLADKERLVLQRLSQRSDQGNVQLVLAADAGLPLQDGDLIQAMSVAGDQQPGHRRNRRVRVDGEVARPGVYVLPAGATLPDAIHAAGGLTTHAFLYGTELRREKVRLSQEVHYERALYELEAKSSRLALQAGEGESARPEAAESARRQMLTRLRARRPEGRMVIDVTPDSQALPPLELEDDDHVRVPARGLGVGVFGSVINPGTFAHGAGQTLGAVLKRAGGAAEGADADGAFVVRANGSVVAVRDGRGWGARERFEALPALPGDTLFVPDPMVRVTWLQAAKDWTQVLYQLGIGVAALAVFR